MNRRQNIIVSITGIFIIILALVGLTYAYFLTRITGNENDKSISVTTANLELVYGDGNNLVTASNIEPGDPITPKTFTVTNNGNATVENFNIYLEDVRNTLSRKTDLIYTITCENTTEGATSTACEDFEVVENEVNGEELVFPSVVSVVARDTLDPATDETNAEQHTYTITLTYKEMNVDQSEDMNKLIEAKVNIYDSKTKFLASEILKNVRTNSNTIYTLPSELPTKIAEEASGDNEKILSYTFDDYGTSYYYRGVVEDNYVNFAGMCWKIVRIEGDGSVKLILEDSDVVCNDASYKGDWDIPTDKAVPYESDYVYYSNYDYTLKYGAKLNSFLTPDEGTNSASKATNNFYESRLVDYNKYLKNDKWCLNDNAYAAKNSTINSPLLTQEEIINNYTNKTRFYYDSYIRLHTRIEDGSVFDPKLTCQGNTFNSYVGLITADEVIYSGGTTVLSQQHNFYLINQRQKNTGRRFWTLSPYDYYIDGTDRVFVVDVLTNDSIAGLTEGGFLISRSNDTEHHVRPVVVLKSDTTITTETTGTGNLGTQTNPYIVG